MTNPLDSQIARVLAELNKLKQQKMDVLKRQMRQLEQGVPEASSPQKRAYRSFTDTEVKDMLAKAVETAGDAGISALKAAEETGVPYTRVRPLMPKLFRKIGSGRGTLYVLRKKRGS